MIQKQFQIKILKNYRVTQIDTYTK